MIELHYSPTNTYLIEGDRGRLLVDTGWAGTFPAFCHAMGEHNIPVQDIDYLLVTHFHPDHMGIAQEIANLGVKIAVIDVQRDFIHASDAVFAKEKNSAFIPIREQSVRIVPISDSRAFLGELGIDGEILHTPGHSDDSVSLILDDGTVFVGDLNPLYEIDLHAGTRIEESWKQILSYHPKKVCYGHAKSAILDKREETLPKNDLHSLVKQIMKLIDKGVSAERIQAKTGADKTFIEDVTRMYLTHRNVGVQGILDRIEIKGK